MESVIAGNNTDELPRTPELLGIARRLIWWIDPAEALGLPTRFLAQVMTLGTWEDVQTVKAQVGVERFRQTLAVAPPGVFDPRSWHYWHHVFGIVPVPPLPRRQFS